jgi:hypothetical protein
VVRIAPASNGALDYAALAVEVAARAPIRDLAAEEHAQPAAPSAAPAPLRHQESARSDAP